MIFVWHGNRYLPTQWHIDIGITNLKGSNVNYHSVIWNNMISDRKLVDVLFQEWTLWCAVDIQHPQAILINFKTTLQDLSCTTGTR